MSENKVNQEIEDLIRSTVASSHSHSSNEGWNMGKFRIPNRHHARDTGVKSKDNHRFDFDNTNKKHKEAGPNKQHNHNDTEDDVSDWDENEEDDVEMGDENDVEMGDENDNSQDSADEDGDGHVVQESPLLPQHPPLESLGTVYPLFDMIMKEEKSEDEIIPEFEDFQMEFVSDDTHEVRNIVECMPTTQEQSLESVPQFGQAPQISKNNNSSLGKVLKNVRNQLSMTNLKRIKKQAKSSFSKTMLDFKIPENAYPSLKPDKMSVSKVLLLLKEDEEAIPNQQGQMITENIPTIVTAFRRNAELHTDPNFKNFVTCQIFPRTEASNEFAITLPNCVDPISTYLRPNLNKEFVPLEEQLRTTIHAAFENVKMNEQEIWEKAIEFSVDNITKDFSKIFMYISSKVELVDSPILTLKYSNINDTLAVGSHNGVLKLLQFEDLQRSPGRNCNKTREITSSVVRNELLKGHTEKVTGLQWMPCTNTNRSAQLMTVDAQGVIIGWLISDTPGKQGVSFVQDRTSSIILDFAWSPESTRIVIIYSDPDENAVNSSGLLYGLVVGTSSGHREWGKFLSSLGPPQAVAWLDETRFIVIQDNIITVNCFSGQRLQTRYFGEDEFDTEYESLGNLVSLLVKKSNTTAEDNSSGPFAIGLVWQYKICLLRSVNDSEALIFDPQLNISCADWSPNGAYIAVGGTKRNKVISSQINIYNFTGKLLTTLKMDQSSSISSISWDINSSNLAMGSETMLFIGSVKQVYKFASNGELHAYVFSEGDNHFVAFWDKTNINIQEIDGKVVDLKNHGSRFVLLTINSEGMYAVAVTTKMGLCIDVLPILEMQPFAVCLTDICLICLSANSILFWKYNSSLSQIDGDEGLPSNIQKEGDNNSQMMDSARQIHIDDRLLPVKSARDEPRRKTGTNFYNVTCDAAVCMDAKFDRLFVARFSGRLQIYGLPQGGLLQTVEIGFCSSQILVTPIATKVAFVDVNGSLRFGYVQNNRTKINMDPNPISEGILDMLWSKDMPEFLCVMKRTEMCIIRNGNFERFANFDTRSGCLAGFDNLAITLVKLDEILKSCPKGPNSSHLFKVDMQILESMRQSFKCQDEMQISAFKENAKSINHTRLWNALGEEELKQKNFDEAEMAFINSSNYWALQFLKQIQEIPPYLQMAEIFAFIGNYGEASDLYIASKRTDLALDMWQKLDEPRQRQRILREIGGSGDSSSFTTLDYSLEKAEKHFTLGELTIALPMFRKLKEYERVFDCHMVLNDFTEMKALLSRIPKGDPAVLKIAEKYSFLGMTKDAVEIYLDAGNPSKAVEVAMTNLEWNLALEIAIQYGIPMVANSVLQLTRHLLSTGDIMQTVQFLKNCGKPFAAGKLLTAAALRELKQPGGARLMNIKKLLVMGAILLQQRNTLTSISRSKTTSSSRRMTEDQIDLSFGDSIPIEYQPTLEEFRWMRQTPWRGAMSLQYLIMVQKAIYTKHFERAREIAVYLRNYADILGDERVNCFIALASANEGDFALCLGAVSQLENNSDETYYADITKELISRQEERKLQDASEGINTVIGSGGSIDILDGFFSEPSFGLQMTRCIISGKILKLGSCWKCPQCGGPASKTKILRYDFCPLCHKKIIK